MSFSGVCFYRPFYFFMMPMFRYTVILVFSIFYAVKGFAQTGETGTTKQLASAEVSRDSVRDTKPAPEAKKDSAEIIQEPMLENKSIRIFKGNFRFMQPVEIEVGMPPFLIITIHGFAANSLYKVRFCFC
jgi:hypothetical protein